MKKHLACVLIMLCTTGVLAQEVSYTNVSKYMLDNEILRSPVYTKKMYRSVREMDTFNYDAQIAELEMLKQNRQLSAREYNEKKLRLDQEYNKIYASQNPTAQANAIKQNAPAAFYYGVMKTDKRLNLMALSSQDLTDEERDVQSPILPQPLNQNTQPQKINRRAAALKNITQSTSEEAESMFETGTTNVQAPAPKNKKTLGRKSIPVKIGAF